MIKQNIVYNKEKIISLLDDLFLDFSENKIISFFENLNENNILENTEFLDIFFIKIEYNL